MTGRGPPRVLFVVSSGGLGGGERVAVGLARELIHRGQAEVTVASPGGGWVQSACVSPQITHVPIRLSGFLDLRSLLKLCHILHRRRFALVHTHLNVGSFLGGWAARVTRTPCVATVHGLNRRRHYATARRLIAVSRAVSDHLIRQDPRLAPRIRVVPNGPDPCIRADREGGLEMREALRIPPDHVILGVLGKLHLNKGQQVALRALAELPAGFELLLGGSGPERHHLESLASELSVEQRVHFLGALPDPSPLYGILDLVLIPSREEAFSLVAAEARNCGVRVLAHDTGGLREAAGPGARFVDSLDPGAWAEGIRQAIRDPAPVPEPRDPPWDYGAAAVVEIYGELSPAFEQG